MLLNKPAIQVRFKKRTAQRVMIAGPKSNEVTLQMKNTTTERQKQLFAYWTREMRRLLFGPYSELQKRPSGGFGSFADYQDGKKKSAA